MSLFWLSLCLAAAGSQPAPLKVLIHMGMGTNSHIKPLLELGTVLRERNHSVVYAAFDFAAKFNGPYRFPFISLGDSRDVIWDRRQELKEQFGKRVPVNPSKAIPKSLARIAPKAYEATYPVLAGVLDSESPDVVLCDFFSAACRDAAEMKGIPLVTGFQTTDIFGATMAPFLTTSMGYGSITTRDLNFLQRLEQSLVAPLRQQFRYRPLIRAMNRVRAKYGVPPTPLPFGDFASSLGVSSSFVGFEAAIPFPPHIHMVGPIPSQRHAPLGPDLAAFLDAHPRTLYVAFGSAVILAEFDVATLVGGSLLALQNKAIDGVVWGLGQTIAEDLPASFTIGDSSITRDELLSHPHIRTLPWAPQTAVLEHNSTKLFISHGGLESSFEAILSGTPILCMPFLGDQPRNARKLEDAGVARYVDRVYASPKRLARHITQMMEDDAVAANVKRMQTITKFGSRRTEYGAEIVEGYAYTAQICRPLRPYKYGEIPCELQHLALPSRTMPYLQASLFDVYTVGLLVGFAILSLLSYVGWILTDDLFEFPKEPKPKEE